MDEKLRKRLSMPLGRVMDIDEAIKKLNARNRKNSKMQKMKNANEQKNIENQNAAGQKNPKKKNLLFVVGDASIFYLLEKNIFPTVSVFDLMCKRVPVESEWKEKILEFANKGKVFYAKNPPGNVSVGLENAIVKCILAGGGCVQVEGEDDLETLACVAHAPLGSSVLYGQPDEGIVWIDVDEKMRKKAQKLIEKVRKG
jgi:uncharacterized protein (UPF0218 family)